MKYATIDAQLFIENRDRYRAHLIQNSLAIFNAADEFLRNGDQNFKFHQNSDFFYLSGIDQEQSILMLYPDAKLEKYREVLFLRETNEHIAVWEGHKYTKDEATAASGIQTILWLDALPGVLRELMAQTEHVYLNGNEHMRSFNDVPCRDTRFGKDLKEKFPNHSYQRSAPIMAKLRTIKSKWEIELIQQACDITEKAFRRLLSFTKPGVMEYQVEAEVTHEFLWNRAEGHSYYPCLLYTSPSPRDRTRSRMPSSA